MEELYLPPFKESIDGCAAMTVMINSGEVNGIPGHAINIYSLIYLKINGVFQALLYQIGRTL